MRNLLMYRLFDPSFGGEGNPTTLTVSLSFDTYTYKYYKGWQSSGEPCSISNLQLDGILPFRKNDVKNVIQLDKEIQKLLTGGVGSCKVKAFQIINELN